jgi:putative membrane protein
MGYPNTYYGYGHVAGLGLFGLGITILMWVLLVWVIISIIRRLAWGPHYRRERWHRWQEMKGHSALNILDERYAKGEINKEEYEQKKKDIGSQQ